MYREQTIAASSLFTLPDEIEFITGDVKVIRSVVQSYRWRRHRTQATFTSSGWSYDRVDGKHGDTTYGKLVVCDFIPKEVKMPILFLNVDLGATSWTDYRAANPGSRPIIGVLDNILKTEIDWDDGTIVEMEDTPVKERYPGRSTVWKTFDTVAKTLLAIAKMARAYESGDIGKGLRGARDFAGAIGGLPTSPEITGFLDVGVSANEFYEVWPANDPSVIVDWMDLVSSDGVEHLQALPPVSDEYPGNHVDDSVDGIEVYRVQVQDSIDSKEYQNDLKLGKNSSAFDTLTGQISSATKVTKTSTSSYGPLVMDGSTTFNAGTEFQDAWNFQLSMGLVSLQDFIINEETKNTRVFARGGRLIQVAPGTLTIVLGENVIARRPDVVTAWTRVDRGVVENGVITRSEVYNPVSGRIEDHSSTPPAHPGVVRPIP
jgi:hypothetical protein